MTDSPLTTENKKKKPGPHQVLVPVVVILAIVFVTLSYLRMASLDRAQEHAEEAGKPHLPAVGETLQDLDLTTLEGETRKLSSLPGKVKLINIWATWCGPCIAEMPSLVKLHEKYQSKGLEIVGINVDDDPTEVLRPFEKRFNMKFQSFVDPEGRFSDIFGVSSIPFSIVVNQDLEVLLVEMGDRDWFSKSVQKTVEGWLQGKET